MILTNMKFTIKVKEAFNEEFTAYTVVNNNVIGKPQVSEFHN